MRQGLRLIAMTTVFGLMAGPPAKAQSVEELKAELKGLQQHLTTELKGVQRRIDQLEAQQKRTSGEVHREANQAQAPRGPSAPQVQRAEKAADRAQAAAAKAQQTVEQAQQQAAQQAQAIKADAVSETLSEFAPPPGRPSGLVVRIPRVDTTVRLYGFAKMNASTDLTTQDRGDTITPQSFQLFNTAAHRQGGGTQFSARRSRIGMETWTPVGEIGDFHTQFEMDFFGQNVNLTTQASNSSFTPRLRLAYADLGRARGGWGNFLFGQQASTFNDQTLLPIQWMRDGPFLGISNVRQAQFRYTYGFDNGLSVSAAVESPYSDITTTAGASFPDANGGGGIGSGTAPDFTGRLLWRDADIGLLALRGVVRPQINLNNNGAAAVASRFNRGTSGFGVGLTGVINLLDGKLVLMASGNAGNGLGRYLNSTSLGFGAVSNFGLPGITGDQASINPVGIFAGMVGAQYFFTPTLRTNMSLGGARLSLPNYVSEFGGCLQSTAASGTCSAVNNSLWMGTINLVWSPIRAVDIGIEYQHLERHLAAPFVPQAGFTTTGGIQNRIQLTTIGRF